MTIARSVGVHPFAGVVVGKLRQILALAALVLFGLFTATDFASAQSSVRPPDSGIASPSNPTGGQVPGNSLGNTSDTEMWRQVKEGIQGSVSLPNEQLGYMVQPGGESWRLIRNGPLFDYLGLMMIGTLILLAVFFAIRGRVRIDSGKSGRTIERFTLIERTAHWLMALSFIVLAISGLNISYGRDLIMPLIGKEAFGPMSSFLKFSHNYVAFAFMLGLAAAFVMWVVHNIPGPRDVVWLAKGGGLFTKGTHIPAKKFNAGQKIIFWSVMLGGFSLCLSGWALLFPFEHAFFTDTVTMLAAIGLDVPAWLGLPEPPYTMMQEQQANSIWHAIMAVLLTCLVFAHIYIGSIGMEGAYDAMGSGDVDLNWAREHHSLWVDDVMAKKGQSGTGPNSHAAQPAE
ncbi:formate dehydrogenase, gamma subunit [Fulvimarina pelagi HTCC2506]|uniref:Formate dehydrogenase, gamma subunit n=1 Tax=Fulvimarina pelagi HTCC2506 TaxID=314231 RepID=Q0G145_9HYPH|nr:formate dehydrogenase subunit gamma [Fulvimarina pelagi]EAU40794.1 formate dehydrogenase, gamma subunit [Fulvimarina pelagi HTCC2506]